MYKHFLKASAKEMNNDVKIVRMTFLTSFFHSLIAILLIILNLHTLFVKKYTAGFPVGRVIEYLIHQITTYNLIPILIGIALIIFILYSFIYPIGQAAIIIYLKEKGSIRNALKKGSKFFFPMFEFSAISLVFSPITFFATRLKLSILGATDNHIIVACLIIWFIALNIANSFKTYTRYFIVLEHIPLYEAIKKSIQLTMKYRKETFKFVRTQTILLILFSINLILVIGIPFLIMYIGIRFNIMHVRIIKTLVYTSFSVLILLGSYTSNFIRAFFAYYRYAIFVQYRQQDSEEQKLLNMHPEHQ